MNGNYPYYGYVYIDLAQIMRAYSDGMMRAFMMGRRMQSSAEGSTTTSDSSSDDVFLGVYDRYAYGVYHTPQKYEASKPFWDAASCQQQDFGSYEEALAFARQGVAALNHMSVDSVPAMQYTVDWRERIFQNGGNAL